MTGARTSVATTKKLKNSCNGNLNYATITVVTKTAMIATVTSSMTAALTAAMTSVITTAIAAATMV